MAIEKLTKDLNIIQKLDDEPNDVGGLTSAQLKAEFDKAGNEIKEYLNNTVVPAINSVQTQADASAADRHTHSNKSLLDTYDQTNADIKDAIAKEHTHSNKSVLDAITAGQQAVLAGIKEVTQTLGNATDKVPSEAAVAAAMAANGNIPGGGTTNQALVKASDNALDVTWKSLTPVDVNAIGYVRMLTSKDNLNSLYTAGVYVYYTDSVPSNCPFANAGIVEVVTTDAPNLRMIQRVTRYGVSGQSAYRVLDSGTMGWQEWVHDYNTVNKPTAADIGALPVGATASDVGALPAGTEAHDIGGIGYVSTLPANADLNNYTDNGLYCITAGNASSCANAPISAAGNIMVMRFDGASQKRTVQLWVNSTSTSTSVFYRKHYNGSWSGWINVLTSSNFATVKPTGTYTGTGKDRTVSIGGVGSLLLVQDASHTFFVTSLGAFEFDNDTVSVPVNQQSTEYIYYFREGVTYSGGVLTLTSGSEINSTGDTYTYQVL